MSSHLSGCELQDLGKADKLEVLIIGSNTADQSYLADKLAQYRSSVNLVIADCSMKGSEQMTAGDKTVQRRALNPRYDFAHQVGNSCFFASPSCLIMIYMQQCVACCI